MTDPVLNTWLFMDSPTYMLCIYITYLIFVLKVGPKMMEKRPAFQLRTIMILHNMIQVFFSIGITSMGLNIIIKMFSDEYNSLYDTEIKYTGLTSGWWYFFGKLTELLDTIFFVLRKKQDQVSFLHIYHHSITVIFSWYCLKYLPGEQTIVVFTLNSAVHIIMYSYYFIAALGSKYKKYLWWKKCVTQSQLIQFGIWLIYEVLIIIFPNILTMECRTPKFLTYLLILKAIIFIYLFSDFYRKKYKTKTA
ncbi:very long chain fatty acid elongase 7-like isoform X2 [Anoplolepis gracilipes]|uniref:very long chain fatty acid elongase 7-like isoform X2 n=1 Tax=Anoplolepis gracilipes TaxID=354296 RepID=UPI003B9E9C47